MTTPEDSQQPEPISEKPSLLKELKRPSFLKLFLPVLILVIVLVFVFINMVYMPLDYKRMGEIEKYSDELSLQLSELINNTDVYSLSPEEFADSLNQFNSISTDISKKARDIYYKPRGIIILEFFSEGASDSIELTNEILVFTEPFLPSYKDGYYVDKDLFELRYANTEEIPMPSLEEYKKVSVPLVLLKALVLSCLIYVSTCLIVFINKVLRGLRTSTINKAITLISLFIVSLAVWLFVEAIKGHLIPEELDNFLFPLTACHVLILIGYTFFGVSALIKDEALIGKINKIVTLTAKILVLLLIVILAIISISSIISAYHDAFEDNTYPPYVVSECQNSAPVNASEIKDIWYRNHSLNEGLRICIDPSCKEICRSHCSGNPGRSRNYYGDTPYCICGCST